MTKQEFENLNFKSQKSKVEGKWYYENYKHGLKINKHEVKFDEDFSFKLMFLKDDKAHGCAMLKMYVNNEYDQTLGYYDYDRYSDDPNDLLEDVCVYIANHI